MMDRDNLHYAELAARGHHTVLREEESDAAN